MSKTMLGKAESAESSNPITQSNSGLPMPVLSETPQEITHPFVCWRCSKRFPSTHALGGHQNAHKKERNEERRLYNEQRLASPSRQSSAPVTIPSAKPDSTVPPPPDGGSAKTFGHFAQPAVAVLTNYSSVLPSYGPMVQLQPLPPGFMYMYAHPQSLVFVPAAFEYCPTRTGVKGGEIPYEGSRQENQNYHPYNNNLNTESMPLNLYPHEDRGFGSKAEEHSACSKANNSASTTTDVGPHADQNTSKEEEEELDLTLRL